MTEGQLETHVTVPVVVDEAGRLSELELGARRILWVLELDEHPVTAPLARFIQVGTGIMISHVAVRVTSLSY